MKLSGKVAVVTGGSKGIGLGCVRVFARHGASVVFGARGEEDGPAAQRELAGAGHAALFVRTDVTREEDVRRLIETAVERFGRLDTMVNNAGWHPPDVPVDRITLEDFERLLRVNLTSTFLGCKLAVPHLRRTRGSIVNVSSAVAKAGQKLAAHYVASKAGQIGLTRALASELVSEGVRVNAVCPGGVMTPLVRQWAATKEEGFLAEAEKRHPMGRLATPEEIGEVCAFLASDEASFITGQAIYAEGGVLLQ